MECNALDLAGCVEPLTPLILAEKLCLKMRDPAKVDGMSRISQSNLRNVSTLMSREFMWINIWLRVQKRQHTCEGARLGAE
jgi:hypothetical protein